MAMLVFYEKPGCSSNAKQRQLLLASGATLDVRNLLAEAWTPARLLPFFAGKPVTEWFNRNAPDIRSGAVDPSRMDARTALAAMVENPLLIRRPLIVCGDMYCSGFDWPALARQLDLEPAAVAAAGNSTDPEACRHHGAAHGTHAACHAAGGEA